MIYFCRLKGADAPLNDGWRWVGRDELANGCMLRDANGNLASPPQDVRLLAEQAFQIVNGS
jgi:hypothetical protein